jgi:FlaA1/EpsC-like NDP-sugar epimerase
LKEILNSGRLGVKPVGFIDDDSRKVGKRLDGYPVMGMGDDLEGILEKGTFHGLIISCRDMDKEREAKLLGLCRARGLSLKRFIVQVEDVDFEGEA